MREREREREREEGGVEGPYAKTVKGNVCLDHGDHGSILR